MNKTFLLLASAMLSAWSAAICADVEVPILAVQSLPGGKVEGHLHTCSIGITKRSGQQPLAVSVTENSPSAVGAQLRAAIWLAATTVALERGDPLTGYRIDISFDGSFDGPSAGGVIALALMSVLDHRNLPQDFAFTGTILPNGGVGQVGGVVQKIQAAAKAGKKRVLVPALYRVDTDMNTGKKVDFKDLCESLGMEFVPVTNIHDAYLSIYKLDVVQQPLSSLKLSQKIEGILKDAYAKEVARGDRIYDAIPAAEKAELKQDTLFQRFIKARSDAENYMRAGNFVLAAENASMWSIALAARNRNVNLIFKLNASSLEELIEGLSKELKRATKDVFDDAASYRQMRSWTSKVNSSELDDYCRGLPVFLGMSEAFGFKERQLLEYRKTVTDVKEGFFDKFKSGPSKKDKLAEIDQERIAMKAVQLLFINIADLYRPVAKSSMEIYANIYNESSVKVEAFHRNSENIVYNAAVAADGSFTTDAIQEIAKGSGIDIDSAKAQMAMNSLPYLSLVVQRKFCDETHRTLGTNADLYSLALATQDHSFALTAATRLMLMVQCGQDTDADGNTTYSNNGLVRSLLESSRTEALIAIAKCEASSIPCLNPIMLILGADGKREDVTEDRMDVLEAYLQAGMQAKILRLLFSKSNPEVK